MIENVEPDSRLYYEYFVWEVIYNSLNYSYCPSPVGQGSRYDKEAVIWEGKALQLDPDPL